MTRERLPNRRYAETVEIAFPPGSGKRYFVTLGVADDSGRIGEVFLTSVKGAGSQADLAARDIALLISINLQHGATLDELAHAMTHDASGNPEGLAGLVLTALLDRTAQFAVEGA